MTALMPQFHIARPRDVEAAVAARREHPDSRFLAGGTDLVVNMRHGIASPTVLIDLAEIGELAGIEATDAGVRIGASVTVAALPLLPDTGRALSRPGRSRRGDRRPGPPRHGDGRRQSVPRYALHLLQSE